MEENKNVIAETGDKEEVVSKNFIEREIDKDLAEGVYSHVQTMVKWHRIRLCQNLRHIISTAKNHITSAD